MCFNTRKAINGLSVGSRTSVERPNRQRQSPAEITRVVSRIIWGGRARSVFFYYLPTAIRLLRRVDIYFEFRLKIIRRFICNTTIDVASQKPYFSIFWVVSETTQFSASFLTSVKRRSSFPLDNCRSWNNTVHEYCRPRCFANLRVDIFRIENSFWNSI